MNGNRSIQHRAVDSGYCFGGQTLQIVRSLDIVAGRAGDARSEAMTDIWRVRTMERHRIGCRYQDRLHHSPKVLDYLTSQ